MGRNASWGLAVVGAVVGAVIGYLAGPSVPVLGGHLPLEDVVTFGGTMGGVESMVLSEMATRAGAMFWGGAALFGAAGVVVGRSAGSSE